MLGDDHLGLKVGKTALTWILGQTNVWYMLYHFAHKASKENSFTQIQSDVSILDDLFSLGGESEQQHSDLEEFSRYLRNNIRGKSFKKKSDYRDDAVLKTYFN
ncbi:unnamed protein product [Ceutorhynchus assimilis]|uniref:Uncharacterized protein n=1 Tax=Ceutorhynchus assimilis TaxID=467358 RepID=A0A9N9MJS3_9CUCU|nr:unnamed protein product [Ceutorhynchus assimilis]